MDMACMDRGSQCDSVTLHPDLSTLRSIPWAADGKFKVAEVTCESRLKADKFSLITCPRSIAKQQLKRLNDLGLELYSAFELEYCLFHVDGMQPLWKKSLYMDHEQQNTVSSIMFKLEQNFLKAGVDIEKMHAEYAPGMLEAALHPRKGIASADAATYFKHGVKEMAHDFDMKASFISEVLLEGKKWYLQSNFNHSLISNDTQINVFFDKDDDQNLSCTARRWIAGIIKHAKALSALMCPTVNCYPGYEHQFIPKDIYWQIDDRQAMVRVKNSEPKGTYVENRIPSGLSNPYIVLAATIVAGMDGIKNELECLSPGEQTHADQLPQSLNEALDALQSDKEIKAGLGEEFVAWYVLNRRYEAAQFPDGITKGEKLALGKEVYL